MRDPSLKVAVFIDWQNVYRSAREAFDLERMPGVFGNFSPYRLGQILAQARTGGRTGALTAVEVFRGLPSPKYDPAGNAANRRQAMAWRAESPLVTPRTRPLHYRGRFPAGAPVEKGVDVELAMSAIEATLRRRCDVAVVFSHDTDLLPVPEAIARLVGAGRVETASWSSDTFRSRLQPRAPVRHHFVSARVFALVEDRTDYARGRRRRS